MSKIASFKSKNTDIKTPTYEMETPNGVQKMKELILYISEKCLNHDSFGAIKINKMLYFSEFRFFNRYGLAITGAKYRKLQFGPAPCSFVSVRDEMERDKEIFVREEACGDKIQQRILPLRKPNLKLFSGEEIAVVDEVIEELRSLSALGTSNRSHGVAWKTREMNDFIPYEASYLSDEPLDDRDIEKAKELEKDVPPTKAKIEPKYHIIEEPSFTKSVGSLGDVKALDEALSPIIEGLQLKPEGFLDVPGTRIRVAKTFAIKRKDKIIPAIKVWFKIEDTTVYLLDIEKSVED